MRRFCGSLAAVALFVGTWLADGLENPVKAAADNTLGMALLGAVVNGDGTLHHGAGVVSTSRPNKGTYEVTFNRDITACFATASAQGFAIYASIFVPTTNTLRVFLSTQSTLAVEWDGLFHVTVFCPR